MSQPSALSHLCKSVRSLTSSGNGRCHHKPRERESPSAPLRELSPKVMNVVILGIMWAIGDSQQIPDLGSNFLQKNLSPCKLTWWCCTDTLIDVPTLQTVWWQKRCGKFGPWHCRKSSQTVVIWWGFETLEKNLPGIFCSQKGHMQWMRIGGWVSGRPNLHLWIGVLAFLWALGPPSTWIVDDGYAR